MKVFLDTNVWIDFLLERRPFYEAAAAVLSLADEGHFDMCISSLTAVNAHYVCCQRAKMSPGVLKHKLSVMADIVDMCDLTAGDIRQAYTMGWSDFEDCVQHNIALRTKADCIVTRNGVDFALSAIAVYTPEAFLQRVAQE